MNADAWAVVVAILHDTGVLMAQWAVHPWVLPFLAVLVVATVAANAAEAGDHPDGSITVTDRTERIDAPTAS